MASFLRLRDPLDLPSADHDRVFHDAALQMLVLKRGGSFSFFSLCSRSGTRRRVTVGSDAAPCLLAKLSLDGCLLVVQRSSTELVVHDVSGGAAGRSWVLDFQAFRPPKFLERPTGGNAILSGGVIWSDHGGSSQDLLVVTRQGVEFFKVSRKRGSCKHYHSIAHNVSAFWFEPQWRLLLLATGQHANRMRGYFLRFDTSDMPRLELPPPHRAPSFQLPLAARGVPLQPSQEVGLVLLYGAPHLCHLRASAQPPSAELYRITYDAVVPGRRLCFPACDAPQTLRASVVDNLLLLHDAKRRRTLLFDTRAREADGAAAAPATLNYVRTAREEALLSASDGANAEGSDPEDAEALAPLACAALEGAAGAADACYDGRWPPLAPSWFYDPGRCAAWRLSVDLCRLAPLVDESSRLFRMLLRRGAPPTRPPLARQASLRRGAKGGPSPGLWRLHVAAGGTGHGANIGAAAAPDGAAASRHALLLALEPRGALLAPLVAALNARRALLRRVALLVERGAAPGELSSAFAALAAAECAAEARGAWTFGVQALDRRLEQSAACALEAEVEALGIGGGLRRSSAASAPAARGRGASGARPIECDYGVEGDGDGDGGDALCLASEGALGLCRADDVGADAESAERALVTGATEDAVGFALRSRAGGAADGALVGVCAALFRAARGGGGAGHASAGCGVLCGGKAAPSRLLPARNRRVEAPDGRLVVAQADVVFHVLLPAALRAAALLRGRASGAKGGGAAAEEARERLEYVVCAGLELAAACCAARAAEGAGGGGCCPLVAVLLCEAMGILGRRSERLSAMECRIAADSEALGRYLAASGDGALGDLGCDMLQRLDCHGALLEALLRRGRLGAAMAACRRRLAAAGGAGARRDLRVEALGGLAAWVDGAAAAAEELAEERAAERAAHFYAVYRFLGEVAAEVLEEGPGGRGSMLARACGGTFPERLLPPRVAETLRGILGFR